MAEIKRQNRLGKDDAAAAKTGGGAPSPKAQADSPSVPSLAKMAKRPRVPVERPKGIFASIM